MYVYHLDNTYIAKNIVLLVHSTNRSSKKRILSKKNHNREQTTDLKEKRAKIVNIKKERRKDKTKSKTKNKTKTKIKNKTENKSKTNTFPSYPSSPPAMISGAIQYGVPMTVWRRDDTASPLTPKSPAGADGELLHVPVKSFV